MVENYLKLQYDIRDKIEKGFLNFKKSPKDRITMGYIETRLETLEKLWNNFTVNHQKLVYEVSKPVLDSTEYVTNDEYDQCEEVYIDYKALLRDKLLLLPKSGSKTTSEPQAQPNRVKLPKIEIPKFSGKYSEWPSFRDLFVSLIHKESSMDNVQKLHYLKSYVTCEAEQLLRHIPCTADNYKTCWDILEGRYNNKKYQANCILKRLTSQKALTAESSSAIKQLLDTTKECMSALKNLGIDVRSWDVIVIFLVSQKLDAESRKQWEQRVSESGQDLPTLKSFEEFLETRFRSIEFLDSKVQKADKVNYSHVSTNQGHDPISKCLFCSEGHKLPNCKQFSKENVEARRNFVQAHNLCFNCMSPNHSVYQCNSTSKCRICKKKHHSLLHTKIPKSANGSTEAEQPREGNVVATVLEDDSTQQPDQASGTDSDHSIVSYFSNTDNQVLLATSLVKVHSNKTNTTVVIRSLLDQGSQASFVTEAAVQMLGLKKITETSFMSGLGGDQSSTLVSKYSVVLKIQSRLDPSFTVTVKAHVLNKLTTLLPSKKVSVKVLPTTLSLLELADPTFHTPNKIDLLLGAEVYSQILLEGLLRGLPGSLIAQQTRFGWILSGKLHNSAFDPSQTDTNVRQNPKVVNLHLAKLNEDELLKKFWELESSQPTKKHWTDEEVKCEAIFTQTASRDESGRFVVKLPFKSENPACKYGNSLQIARKRFLWLERRISKNPELKIEYSKVLNEYLSLGHMEKIGSEDIDNPDAVYLPHHAVIRKDKTTSKVRVVFDASCKGTNGVSLNDDLMIGPTLQPELRHLVMRWRTYAISLVADIVKMYRQVKVAEEDADFQRILWREDPNNELQHFRLLTVTFGTSSAPFLAVRVLQELARIEKNEFPLASTRVLNDFYMDDLMSGCQSVEEGVQVYKEITQLLNRGGFPLQKFSSNSKELLQRLHVKDDVTAKTMEIKTDEIIKILGLTWNKDTDQFQFTVKLSPLESPVTKRKVISDIARLFDPLGWIAPVITKAKIFIQQLWLSGIEWDSALPSQLLNDWIRFREDLKSLTRVTVPRWIRSSKDDICVELHGFSDASNAAYAAIVYARIVSRDGCVHVSLISSKTRVAPIKQVSIPRLELCGAVLLSKLLTEVASTLQVPSNHIHAWTDSMIVLAWISSHPRRWKTFVANRVSEILSTIESKQWSHVASDENPADCASRGLLASEFLENRLWHQGPEWLRQKTINYGNRHIKDTKLEEKKPKIACLTIASDDEGGNNLLNRFSSLSKLVRVIAYCRRVLTWNKPDKIKNCKWLTVKELNESLLTCTRLCQKEEYQEDIDSLQSGKIKRNSKLGSLCPFLDADQVLRVGGRLQSADMISFDMRHPVIIPHKSHFAKLLVHEAHIKTLHGGPQITLNYLRNKYWVIGAKKLVRQCVHKCVKCIRYSAQSNQQMMGQLPTARVTAHRPFLRSGVDYAGPISVRTTKGRGHHATKGYICLFVCMATRAIHLEMVSDMTSETFLAAFKRFVARRGHVAELWSDNGSTFVGSARELKELFNLEKNSISVEIADWLAANGTAWHFIPPHSPNFGGLWEAGVKSTKYHLKRVIGDSTLTFEEMTTVLSQIEACLNSRPISQLSNNPEDPNPLTPGHFLVGESLLLAPDANYETSTISSLKRWHLTQRMVQDFWRRWSHEYLTQLQHRYKWTEIIPEPDIGSVVLVKEDDLPPARWLFGVVVDKHPGLDKLTRVVSIKYKGNIIKRPLSKLILLPA